MTAPEDQWVILGTDARVQAAKVYVQDRLAQSAALVWGLLQAGGHFYVCGDAAHMAGAVEDALLAIIQAQQACACCRPVHFGQPIACCLQSKSCSLDSPCAPASASVQENINRRENLLVGGHVWKGACAAAGG